MENLDQSNNKNVSLSLIAEYGTSDSESDDTEAHSIENMLHDESEESLELSQMVLKNNIINACAHGPLSGNVREDVESTRHMIIDSAESGVVEYEVTEYRDVESESESSTSSDSSDSEVDSVKDVEELSSSDENEASNTASKVEGPPKVQGEMGLDDLPPIEDLAISLPSEQTTRIGTIASIVDRLVIVRALPETPAVDLDSILFVDNGAKALGKVFDVFGPVTEPHYCVRFNSQDHVKERGVQPGMDVYIAPDTQHTKFVFLSQLMKIKGSDASWLNDIEPPPSHIEYSDDEDERQAKRQQKLNKQGEAAEGDVEEPKRQPQQRHQRPADGSSRFGSGPSRGRNPFATRRNNPNSAPRYGRPWADMRTPPPHGDFNFPPFSAPPMFPPMFPPPFNPNTPPPFGGNQFQFGGNQFQFGRNQRMLTPTLPHPIQQIRNSPPFRQQGPVFGTSPCTMPGPQPQWVNNGTPPPPGT